MTKAKTFRGVIDEIRASRGTPTPAPRDAGVGVQQSAAPETDELNQVLAKIARRQLQLQQRSTPKQQRQFETWRAADAGRVEAQQQLELVLSRDEIERHIRLDALQRAIRAYPRELEKAGHYDSARPQTRSVKAILRRVRRSLARTTREISEQLQRAFDAGDAGPNCAPGDADVYVQEEDLDDLVPDEWGRSFPAETKQLARHLEMAPLVVPLLCILEWASRCREPHPKDSYRRGAGAQFSIKWLARKLGCCPTWVKELLNRLDPHAAWRRDVARVRRRNRKLEPGVAKEAEPARPTGTPYLQRFRQLRRYEHAKQEGRGRWGKSDPDVFWVDARGVPHQFVDLRGVCYVTDAGRALVQPRVVHRDDDVARERRNGNLIDLAKRGMRLRLLLSRRLEKTVDAPLEKSTSDPPRGGAG